MNNVQGVTLHSINERLNNLYSAAILVSPLHDGQPKDKDTKKFNGVLSEISMLKQRAVKILSERRSDE